MAMLTVAIIEGDLSRNLFELWTCRLKCAGVNGSYANRNLIFCDFKVDGKRNVCSPVTHFTDIRSRNVHDLDLYLRMG